MKGKLRVLEFLLLKRALLDCFSFLKVVLKKFPQLTLDKSVKRCENGLKWFKVVNI